MAVSLVRGPRGRRARPSARRPAARAGPAGRHGDRGRRDGARARHPRLLDRVRRRQQQPGDAAPLLDHRPVVGALAGSILLWGFVALGLRRARWSGASAPRPPTRSSRGRLSSCSCVAAFFIGLMVGPANPFAPRGRARRRPRGPGPTPCCRTTRWWPSTRRSSTSGSSGSPCRSPSPIGMLATGRVGDRWQIETRRWTLDRLDVPLGRHRARGLVVLPGARLGRLLGLGPGRERGAPALAVRHRLPALGAGPGAAGAVAGVEPVAVGGHVLAHHPRDLPHPLRASSSRCTPSATRPSDRC